MQIQPVASGGAVHVNVVDLRVGSVPVPGALVSAVGDSINSSVRTRTAGNTVVRAVRVTPSGLEIDADSR
jgi:hypothetical protein